MKATVIIPTHNHADTLLYSIPSALSQTVEEIEVFVIGDGVPERAREIMRNFTSQDNRVRFFDFPKGPRHGEEYRHKVLTESATGEIVCYLCDDDLWLPNHVETMLELLNEKDFAHSLPLVSEAVNSINVLPINIECSQYQALLLTCENRIPLLHFGHTLSFYKCLPYGWRTTPAALPTDLYMYQQCLKQPGCRLKSGRKVTAIHFNSPLRKDVSEEVRLQELQDWSVLLQQPHAYQDLLDEVVCFLVGEVVSWELRKKVSPFYLYTKKFLKILRKLSVVRKISAMKL